MIKISPYKESGSENLALYHEDTNIFDTEFYHNCELLIDFFQKFGNPSEDNETNLIDIISR